MEPQRWRDTNNQMVPVHQTGSKTTEKPHKSKRCLFLPNKDRNKKLSQMPILIAFKVEQLLHIPNDGDLAYLSY